MGKPETVKDIALRKLRILKDDRSSWEQQWKDIAKYCLPYAGRFAGDKMNDGSKKGQDIMDSFPGRCISNLAAFLFTGLSSPSRPWFRLRISNADMQDDAQVKEWLEIAEQRMYQAFLRSNFYLEIHRLYVELPTFGSTCMYIESDTESFLRCKTFTIGQFYIAQNDKGVVDTCLRVVPMTARQVALSFGEDKVPSHMQAALKNDTVDTFDVLHAVFPNPKYDETKVDSQSMPFVSIYLDLSVESDPPLRVAYYAEFPYMTPRWIVTGQNSYGQSPGFDALSEIRQLQVERQTRLDVVQKIADPPLLVPASFTEQTIKTFPGALNPEPVGGGQNSVRPLYEINWNIAAVINEMQESHNAIASLFFNDLILMVDEGRNKTATEVLETKQEKMLMLGPIVERLQSELLGPIIDRVFSLLGRQGVLPPTDSLPPEVQGAPIQVDYISPLAQAQQKTGIDAINAAVAFATQCAALDVSALDRIDLSEAVQTFATLAGVPANLIRPDDVVQAMRQQRQQAQVEQQQREEARATMPVAADAASKAAGVDMQKDTLATRMFGGGPNERRNETNTPDNFPAGSDAGA